ncbi:response regulator [Spirosoma sp. HMF4905]|uniref:Response regulator n=1 Tax=Spirosoma arboris TaxID=2682092 RepID=A0A7K1SFY6_9BACT|nr:response regulator [Spirosoma arboris]MVM32476.1 response regulator [Spirosoma arboris]
MPRTNPPQIWIVDDDEDDQYLFAGAFKSLSPSLRVQLFNDGEDLLPALAQSTRLPDLIILDLNMPRVNGFEALKLLRAEPSYQRLPVIVLTTSDQLEDQTKALALGADGFLTKPPSFDKILILFEQLVQQWQLV